MIYKNIIYFKVWRTIKSFNALDQAQGIQLFKEIKSDILQELNQITKNPNLYIIIDYNDMEYCSKEFAKGLYVTLFQFLEQLKYQPTKGITNIEILPVDTTEKATQIAKELLQIDN